MSSKKHPCHPFSTALNLLELLLNTPSSTAPCTFAVFSEAQRHGGGGADAQADGVGQGRVAQREEHRRGQTPEEPPSSGAGDGFLGRIWRSMAQTIHYTGYIGVDVLLCFCCGSLIFHSGFFVWLSCKCGRWPHGCPILSSLECYASRKHEPFNAIVYRGSSSSTPASEKLKGSYLLTKEYMSHPQCTQNQSRAANLTSSQVATK